MVKRNRYRVYSKVMCRGVYNISQQVKMGTDSSDTQSPWINVHSTSWISDFELVLTGKIKHERNIKVPGKGKYWNFRDFELRET